MAAGTAEPVVEIEVAKGGIEIVDPHQTDDAAAEPDAFRVPGGAVEGLGGLDKLGCLALIVLGGVGRGIGGGLARLIAALGERAAEPEQQEQAGNCELAHNRHLWLKHPSTHKFPDKSPTSGPTLDASVMPLKWVSNTAETPPECPRNPMT